MLISRVPKAQETEITVTSTSKSNFELICCGDFYHNA